VLDTPLLPKT